MRDFETPLLFTSEQDGGMRLNTNHCQLMVEGITYENARFGPLAWIDISPSIISEVTTTRLNADLRPTLDVCMLWQRLFLRAGEVFGMYVVPKLRQLFTPPLIARDRVYESWLTAVSTEWSGIGDDTHKTHQLELDVSMIEGVVINISDEKIKTRDLANLCLRYIPDLPITKAAPIVSTLLLGVAYWYDNLVELAIEWGIPEALKNNTPLYHTVLQENETNMYGRPTLSVSPTHVDLIVDLSTPEKNFIVSTSQPCSGYGLSLANERNYVGAMAPKVMGQLGYWLNIERKAKEATK